MKTVYKPWGREEWLELNSFYCYKRIYINKGTRTSFQYHVEKLETNYIIAGTAEVWLENQSGVIEKKVMKAGDFFTVHPPKKHRVIALTDLILQEVSTPQVDDVIRIQDDVNRKDGKIESEHKTPAMCILTAGKGSRLGQLSSHVNKALIPINHKAAISYIIDKTPVNYDIIIASGYKGDQVINYCNHMHPNRNFKFVNVDSYDPLTTGPATSLYACKDHLQRPFMFAASDIIIENESIGNCDSNWLSTCETALSEIYATVNIKDEKILNIIDKSTKGFSHAWTGLMSIYNYESFWNNFEKSEKEIPNVIKKCLDKMIFFSKDIPWYDLGTYDSYISAKKHFESNSSYIIPKQNFEMFYKRNNRISKYHPESESIKKLIDRVNNFKDKSILPNYKNDKKSLLCYDWIQGKDLYDIDDFNVYKNSLEYFYQKLWSIPVETKNNIEISKSFYKNLSIKRIDQFLLADKERKDYFGKITINDNRLCDFDEQMSKVFSHQDIFKSVQVKDYHGDFHFSNIIFNNLSEKYSLIDLRPCFYNNDGWGDMYYDLAKLYAGCEVQFSKIKNFDETKFRKLVKEESFGNYKILEHKSKDLIKFKFYLQDWIKDKKLDLKKVKYLAGIVLCKISCLHETWQANFLFLNGRRVLNDANKIT